MYLVVLNLLFMVYYNITFFLLIQESTSIDTEPGRHRNQSGPQEPQSTTTHSLPMTSFSAPLKNSTLNTSVLQEIFSMADPLSTTSGIDSGSGHTLNSFASGVSNPSVSDTNVSNRNFSLSEIAHNITKNKKLDNLFNLLWEETNDENGNESMKEKLKNFNNLKRKASVLESKSESGIPGDAGTDITATSEASKLSKENALLTQLLSKRSNTDIVVNTLSTIQPSGVPQTRIPSNLANKLLKVNPSSFNNTPSDVKRARTEGPSSTGQLSTLEHALRMPKKDLNTSVSSSTPFDPFEIGNNSNSGISNISDSSVSSQLTELQQILQQNVSTEVNLDDNTDPLLAQILQQAQDLQHDISTGFPNNNQNVSQSLPLDSGITHSAQNPLTSSNSVLSTSFSSVTSSANSGDLSQTNQLPSYNIVQQLEALQDPFNLDIDMPSSTVTSMDERLAIERIEKELMMTDSELPPYSMDLSQQTPSHMTNVQTGRIQAQQQQQQHQGQFMQNIPRPSPPAGSQIQDNSMLGNQMMGGMRNQYSNQNSMTGSPRSLPQLQGYNSPAPPAQSFPSPGPRLPHPTGEYIFKQTQIQISVLFLKLWKYSVLCYRLCKPEFIQ